MKKIIYVFLAAFLIFSPALADDHTEDRKAIMTLLDNFHDAAAKADKERYLGLFTEEGVFLGTDEWERWPLKPDFTDYVAMRFEKGGWSYKSEKRNITFAKDGQTAWFDETSVNQRNKSRFRGSGVVEKVNGEWKMAHYVLSFLVYNEIAGKVGDIIIEEQKKRGE